MLRYIASVSVSVTDVTVNHSFGVVSDTVKTQNTVSAAVLVTTVTEKCAFGWSLKL